MRALVWLSLLVAVCAAEELRENLLLRSLADGKLLAHARFAIDGVAVDGEHFALAPKSLGQLLAAHDIAELRFSLGAGRWYVEHWGLSPFAAPEGMLVSARFRSGSKSGWDELLHALGGLFGASASLLRGSSTAVLADGKHMAAFGGEALCTENLTPWLNLLPCRGRAGLGALLDPLRVFGGPHHALGLVATVSEEGVAQLTFDIVMVAAQATNKYWTAQSVFGTTSISACPLSSRTVVNVDDVLNRDPSGTAAGEHVLETSSSFDFMLSSVRVAVPKLPSANAVRYLTGSGLEKGGIKSVITNNGLSAMRVDYLEVMPWYFRIAVGSVRVEGAAVAANVTEGVERQSPSVVQLIGAQVPAGGNLTLTYQFSKSFLHLSEHPPDAHHGFFIPAARVTLDDRTAIYTDVLVAQVALPDFSMPFNVVTMSGIIVGFAFGSSLGILTARYSLVKRGQQLQSTRPLARLLRLILALIDRYA